MAKFVFFLLVLCGVVFFGLLKKDVGTSELVSILLFLVSLFTFYLARLQYQANHAPIIAIMNYTYRVSREDESVFKIAVKNLGRGVCIDSFLILKEKDQHNHTRYYLSSPIREIQPDTAIEFSISKDASYDQDAHFMFVYMDFFGHKYLASDAHNGRANPATFEHLDRFTTPAKPLWLLHPVYVRFRWWKYRAVRQGNTPKERHDEKIKSIRRNLKEFDPIFYSDGDG